jgi:hypothetical protein
MNKIVQHYPVDRLPEDLRDGLPEHGWVEIEFRPKGQPQPRALLAPLVGSVESIYSSDEEVLQYIRQLREDR